MSNKKGPARTIKVYRSYNFIDKDPCIDWVHSAMDRKDMSPQKIQDAGGPTATTVYNWINGRTRRPQFCTIAAAAMACGVTVIDLRKVLRKE